MKAILGDFKLYAILYLDRSTQINLNKARLSLSGNMRGKLRSIIPKKTENTLILLLNNNVSSHRGMMMTGVMFALSHTLFQMDQREYVHQKKKTATLLRHERLRCSQARYTEQNKHSHSHVRRDPTGMHEAGVNLNC